MANARLPPGWEARWDNTYGRYYFIDHATQKTTWTDPRLTFGMFGRPTAAEHIPLRDFTSRQASTSAQSSSTARTKETGFQHSIDFANDEDADDEEWRNALFLSSMENDKKKRLLFHEKVNMKEKFKREFQELDSSVVESTVEKHDYDEDMTRATLESLKDAHMEKQRKKREAEERKRREEEKRKAQERRKEFARMRKELLEKREAERKAEIEAERQRAAAAKQRATSSAFTVDIKKLSQQKTTTRVKPTPPSREKVAAKQKPENRTVVKPSTTPKPAGREASYVSPNRLQPVGPQPSLRKGPDRSLLVRHYSNASGANRALVSGPQRSNCKGPAEIQPKESLSKGPQASLRQGPQCRLIHGQRRPLVTGQPSRILSAV